MVFIIFSSILLIPLPIFLMCCCKSHYYLLKPKGINQERIPSDLDPDDPNYGERANDYDERATDVRIDTDIPIRLLFLVNAVSNEELTKEYKGKFAYCSGNIRAVGQKLMDLDKDFAK